MAKLGKKHTRDLVFYTRRLVTQYGAWQRELALSKVTEGVVKEIHTAQAKAFHDWAKETEQTLAGLGVYPGLVFFEGQD